MNKSGVFLTHQKIDTIWRWIITAAGSITVLLLLGIFFFLVANASGIIGKISLQEFFLTSLWNPSAYTAPSWGIASLVVGTLIISIVSLVLAVPLGIGIAIYLSDYASPKVREILKPCIEMIASIPSVVLGLIGILTIGPLVAKIFGLTNGFNALTASIIVGISALPTIASVSEDALSSVNDKIRESSLALGATRWATVSRVLIPAARSGIIGAIMLGFGRVIGETMIVLMVAGNSLAFPQSVLDPVRPMTASIAIEIKEVVMHSLHWDALFAVGLVLFIITFLINIAVDIWTHKKQI